MIIERRAYSIVPSLDVFERFYLSVSIGFSSLKWGLM